MLEVKGEGALEMVKGYALEIGRGTRELCHRFLQLSSEPHEPGGCQGGNFRPHDKKSLATGQQGSRLFDNAALQILWPSTAGE